MGVVHLNYMGTAALNYIILFRPWNSTSPTMGLCPVNAVNRFGHAEIGPSPSESV